MNLLMYVKCMYLSVSPLQCATAGLTSSSVNSLQAILFTGESHCIRLKNKKVCMCTRYMYVSVLDVCMCAGSMYVCVLTVYMHLCWMYVCMQDE